MCSLRISATITTILVFSFSPSHQILKSDLGLFLSYYLKFIVPYHLIPPMCFYLVVVVGLVCANDPKSYVGGSVATGRASQAEQVIG
jgi:hypothetical protein